jgi:hypothetical protein
MYDNRDYDDLLRGDIAVYNFRGYTVLKFNKETHELEFGKHANMCSFINDDLRLMAHFIEQCYLFATGVITEIEHVSVD